MNPFVQSNLPPQNNHPSRQPTFIRRALPYPPGTFSAGAQPHRSSDRPLASSRAVPPPSAVPASFSPVESGRHYPPNEVVYNSTTNIPGPSTPTATAKNSNQQQQQQQRFQNYSNTPPTASPHHHPLPPPPPPPPPPPQQQQQQQQLYNNSNNYHASNTQDYPMHSTQHHQQQQQQTTISPSAKARTQKLRRISASSSGSSTGGSHSTQLVTPQLLSQQAPYAADPRNRPLQRPLPPSSQQYVPASDESMRYRRPYGPRTMQVSVSDLYSSMSHNRGQPTLPRIDVRSHQHTAGGTVSMGPSSSSPMSNLYMANDVRQQRERDFALIIGHQRRPTTSGARGSSSNSSGASSGRYDEPQQPPATTNGSHHDAPQVLVNPAQYSHAGPLPPRAGVSAATLPSGGGNSGYDRYGSAEAMRSRQHYSTSSSRQGYPYQQQQSHYPYKTLPNTRVSGRHQTSSEKFFSGHPALNYSLPHVPVRKVIPSDTRSTPDLDMDSMRSALTEISHEIDRQAQPPQVSPRNEQPSQAAASPANVLPVSRGSLSASSALGSKRFSSGSGSLDSRAGRREYPSDTESLPEAHHSYAENLDKRAAEDAQQRLRRTRSTLSKMSSMFREKSGGIGSSADSRTSSRPSTSSHSLNDRTVGSLRSVSEHNLALFVDQNLSTTPPVPSLPNISLEPTPPALPPHLQDVKPVYPALLSRVAASFVEIMHPILSTNTKNGIDYPNSFSGKEAIDAICALISTSDRALALLVGRALAKQSLFRDIVFENELEDYNHSLYAFTEEVIEKNTPSTVMADGGNEDSARTLGVPVNGVLVMLTKCYSPTCTKDNLCYSMSCPRRQEQLQEKGMAGGEQGKVKAKNWWMTVPKWLLDAVSKKVLNHQEAIFELSYTEHEYVTDLCTIRDHMMKPLHNSDLLPAQNRNRFIASVFKNLLALLATNSEFDVDLQRRQKESMIVDRVGDVVLRHVENFECYIEYGANKIFSKHFLEQEQQRNPRFLQFLEEFARMPEVRKLNIESFLFKPCQRIMHYPLLLHKVLKHTPEGHPDRELIPKAVDKINDICSRMNIETGVASNRLNLMKISELLECKPSEKTDLDLDNDARQLIKSGKMKKRSGVETAEIMVFLFDHMLMMCRIKRGRGNEVSEYRLYKRLIPLQMLAVSSPDGLGSTRVRTNVRRNSFSDLGSASQSMATLVASPTGTAVAPSSTSVSASNTLSVAPLAAGIADGKLGAAPAAPAELDIPGGTGKYVYPITFTHLSRNGGSYTMYMDKLSDRTAWFQMIETQQAKLIERDRRFELIPIATSFPASVKINCSAVFDRGRCVVLGTDQGVYVGIAHKPRSFQLLKTLKHDRIHQIEVIERHNCLLLLADKERTLYSYPLDVLAIARAGDQNTFKPKKLQRNVSFFRYGVCMNSDMLCSVKSKNIPQATTIKVYHPMSMYEVPSRKGFGGLLRNRESISGDIWRSFRDCYIGAEATSLHFLKSKLCIGCNRGFEVIDLATLNPQTLLDPVDESLQFVLKRDNVRPISFFRVQEGEYLLCYDEFAFYVNRNGQRARPNWIIHWEGEPTAVALHYPYILAFDESFIEIRHVETGQMVQSIITGNCRALSTDSSSTLCAYSPVPMGQQEVYLVKHV